MFWRLKSWLCFAFSHISFNIYYICGNSFSSVFYSVVVVDMSATSTFGDSGDVIRSELKFLRQSLEISKLKHDGKKQRQIEDEMKKLTMRLKATNPNQNGRDPQLPPRVSQAKLRDGGSSESVKGMNEIVPL